MRGLCNSLHIELNWSTEADAADIELVFLFPLPADSENFLEHPVATTVTVRRFPGALHHVITLENCHGELRAADVDCQGVH
jgi:hypothetical protein